MKVKTAVIVATFWCVSGSSNPRVEHMRMLVQDVTAP
jgi:hypothetical protein